MKCVQSLPKQDKFSEIINSCTQCGIQAIVPVISDRCTSTPNQSKWANKVDRWQAVAESAAIQSHQFSIPTLHPIVKLSDLAKVELLSTCSQRLVCWEDDTRQLLSTTTLELDNQPIALFIGPEGGLSQGDIENLKAQSFQTVSLGSSILRVQQAGLFAIAQLQCLATQ